MPWIEPTEIKPVGATCPTIDKLRKLARRLPPPLVAQARAMLEEVRQDNAQLRFNAAAWEVRAVKAEGDCERLAEQWGAESKQWSDEVDKLRAAVQLVREDSGWCPVCDSHHYEPTEECP